MNLSPNFTLQEMTFSQTAARLGVDNTPNDEQLANLVRLCETLLEPARLMLEVPLHVDSGFRSPHINQLVGGASNSAHMEGRAADVLPIGMGLQEAFDKLRHDGLPYDQIIIECNAWIHLSIPALDAMARRQALTASGGPGHWSYVLVA